MVPSYSRIPRPFASSPTTAGSCGRGLRGDHAGLAASLPGFFAVATFAGRSGNAEGHP
jgi:hypothetical protein